MSLKSIEQLIESMISHINAGSINSNFLLTKLGVASNLVATLSSAITTAETVVEDTAPLVDAAVKVAAVI